MCVYFDFSVAKCWKCSTYCWWINSSLISHKWSKRLIEEETNSSTKEELLERELIRTRLVRIVAKPVRRDICRVVECDKLLMKIMLIISNEKLRICREIYLRKEVNWNDLIWLISMLKVFKLFKYGYWNLAQAFVVYKLCNDIINR